MTTVFESAQFLAGNSDGSTKRTLTQRTGEIFNVMDFGAIGSGSGELLSTRYGSLGAAQAVYPFVTSLSDTIDWAAIQAAINAMWATTLRGGTVFIPSGSYIVKQGIDIGSHQIGSANTTGRIIGVGRTSFISGNLPNEFIFNQGGGINGPEEISNLAISNISTWIGSGGLRINNSSAEFNNLRVGGMIAYLFGWDIYNASLNNCTGGCPSDGTTGYNGTLGFAGFTPSIKGWRSTNPIMAAIQVSGSNSSHIDGCGIENCVTALLLGTYTGWASHCTVAPDGSNPGFSILTVSGMMGSGGVSGSPGGNPEFTTGMTLFGRGLNLPAWGSDPNDSTGGTTITASHNEDGTLTGVGYQGTYRISGTYTISTPIPIWTRSAGLCSGINVSSIQTEACFHSIYVNHVSGCHISGCGFGSNPVECPNQFGTTGLTPRAPFYLRFASATKVSGVGSAAAATTLGGICIEDAGQNTSGVTFENCSSQKGTDNIATGGISNGSGGSGTVMNITAFTSGVSIGVGMKVTGAGVTAGTVITGSSVTDGTLTGFNTTGTYRISPSQSVAPGTTLTISTGPDWLPPTVADSKTGLKYINCVGDPVSCGLNNINMTFGALPGEGTSNTHVPRIEGQEFNIVDGAKAGGGVAAIGDATQGGGTQHIKVWFNGTNWIRCG